MTSRHILKLATGYPVERLVLWAVMIQAATITSSAQIAKQSPTTRPSQNHTLTVVPPGPVTEKIEVEVRLAVRNDTDKERAFEVSIYRDSPDCGHLIDRAAVRIPARGTRLVQAWWPTAGHVGENVLAYQIRDEAESIAQGSWPLEILPSPTPALPLLQAAWVDPGALVVGTYPSARPATPEDVRAAVNAMKAVGMQIIIITYVEYVLNGWGAFYPTKLAGLGKPRVTFDVVGLILDQAAKNGQHVFIGLGRGNDLHLTFEGFNNAARVERALVLGKQVASELWGLYGHCPSFYGWYLTHEANDIAGAGRYYDPMADYLHAFSPDKPVMVAPSGTPVVTPEILRRSHVDIFAYQDAVGAGYVPYQYTYQPEDRLTMLKDVFASYRTAHIGTRKHIWADLEVWEMAGPRYEKAYAADFSRVRRQIEIEQNFVEMITAYEFLGMMSPPRSSLKLGGDSAARLYRDYRDYYRQARSQESSQEK